MVLGLDVEIDALDAGSPPVDIVEGVVPVPLIFAVAPQIVDLKPPASFAEGRPGQRRAAQARDIQVLFVVQGDDDADFGELRRGGRGHQDESECESETVGHPSNPPRLGMRERWEDRLRVAGFHQEP